MKKLNTTIIASILCSAAVSQAAITINLSGLDLDAVFTSDIGTVGAISNATGGTSATHSFTVSDLDVADDGTANDTVTFSYLVTTTGGNIALVNGTSGASYGVDGASDPGDNEVDPNETISFSNLAISIDSLGDSNPGTFTLQSAGFTDFTARFVGGDTLNVDPTGFTSTGGGPAGIYTFDSPESSFNLSSDTGGNGYGVDNVAATFTIVPEPSSTALLGLGGLALILRRRK